MPCQFSLAEIKAATKEFDETNVIGKGGEGKVYEGHLQIDGVYTTVAIKLLTSNSRDRFEEEINLVSNLHHANLLSLKGYCEESKHMILVYEFMHNGSLSKNLYPNCSLNWTELLNICIGTARGLEYLHRCTSPQSRLIHRDMKPGNILLDENWVAKISDFGLLKRGSSSNRQESNPISTDLKGTFGYYAPEYVFERKITTKTDVYSFGVVLLEILCRKKREWPLHDESNSDSSEVEVEEEEIGEWAQNNIVLNLRRQISVKCLDKLIDIARKCLLRNPIQRPSMAYVVAKLEKSLESELQYKKSSCVLYFSSYNSTSKNIETNIKDSMLVRRSILKELQVNVEEKNVSNHGAYRAKLSQIIAKYCFLPVFTGVKFAIGFDRFKKLYLEGKLTSRLQGSLIHLSCDSCGDSKECATCVCSSRHSSLHSLLLLQLKYRFAVCKICDTLTMLLGNKWKLRCCPKCLRDQLYIRYFVYTIQGYVRLYDSSLSCDDHYFEEGLGGYTFPELTSRVHNFELAITVIMLILAFGLLYWVRISRGRQSNSPAGISRPGQPPNFNHRLDFLSTFFEPIHFLILLLVKQVVTMVTIFMFLVANFYEALLFCSRFLKLLLPYIWDFLVEVVLGVVGWTLIFGLAWLVVVLFPFIFFIFSGIIYVIKTYLINV